MRKTFILTALAGIIISGFASACQNHSDQQVMSCVPGTIWDASSASCVAQPSG